MNQATKMKYPWPASALAPDDMHLLYRAREASPGRQTITRLLARAVRETFGHLAAAEPTGIAHGVQKEAA